MPFMHETGMTVPVPLFADHVLLISQIGGHYAEHTNDVMKLHEASGLRQLHDSFCTLQTRCWCYESPADASAVQAQNW